jgi:hypothetical protein
MNRILCQQEISYQKSTKKKIIWASFWNPAIFAADNLNFYGKGHTNHLPPFGCLPV